MQRQEADSFIPRIAMWSARHRKPVALGWLILVLLAFGACTAVKADTKAEQSVPGEAGRAFDLYKERFRLEEETPQEIAVFQHPNLSVEDASYKQTVSGLMEDLRGLRTTKEEVKGEQSCFPARAWCPVLSPTTTREFRASDLPSWRRIKPGAT